MWSRNKLTLEAQALTGTSLACPIGFVLGAAIGATSSVWRASSVFVIGFYQFLTAEVQLLVPQLYEQLHDLDHLALSLFSLCGHMFFLFIDSN